MSDPVQTLISDFQAEIENTKRTITNFRNGTLRLMKNGIEISDAHADDLERHVAELQKAIHVLKGS